jgi:hypothetical protein
MLNIHISCLLQRTAVASLISVVRTVKVLVLRMSPPSVDDAIDFVRFFPCLEKLYVLVRFFYTRFILYIGLFNL